MAKDLTSGEVAESLGVSPQVFAKFWAVAQRCKGLFPQPYQVGRANVWDRSEIKQWVRKNMIQSVKR